MFPSFRHAATWVHTWFGLALGFVLVVVFFFGSLSVFDREIDRWAIPGSRFAPQPMPSFDKVLRPVFESIRPGKESLEQARTLVDGPLPTHWDNPDFWGASTTHRDPVLDMRASWYTPNARVPDSVFGYRTIDPRSGDVFPDDKLKVGSEFFFPLHYNLTVDYDLTTNGRDLGNWIVGLAALVMLVALISGVAMHRKLFREFFTLRPTRNVQRSVLDLHNMTGVLALPFHFFFALTGLLSFAGTYFPVSETHLRPLHDLHEELEEQETGLPHDRSGIAAPMASVDAMVAEAQRRWAAKGMAGEVGLLAVNHVGDANGYVSVYRAGTDRVASVSEGIHFRASTGQVLREDPPQTAVGGVADFLVGLHLQPFRHWLLRWLYLLGGLMGTACIATGLIFFVGKRKAQHAKLGGQGSRVVDALAVTTITGMLIATMSILNANFLLPDALPSGWPPRDRLEIALFWTGWALAMLHAFARSAPVALGKINPAWNEQCWAIGVLAVSAVLLNWITTGDHLLRTLRELYWPVAGMDLALLFSAAIAFFAARKLKQRAEAASFFPVVTPSETAHA